MLLIDKVKLANFVLIHVKCAYFETSLTNRENKYDVLLRMCDDA